MFSFFKTKFHDKEFVKTLQVKDLNPVIKLHRLNAKSYFLERIVKVDIYLNSNPANCKSTLILNDGQDMEQLRLVDTLTEMTKRQVLPPVAVVAIHANENRMQEYGIAGYPDFKKRGKRAGEYASFVIYELIPFLQNQFGFMQPSHNNIFAGFSMGGLSALDISWNNHLLFNKVGVFSGSFWWRSLNTGTVKDDAFRIMHQRVRGSRKREGLKLWFQTGTNDETHDRNNNGIIDSIDDTVDLIRELKSIGHTDQDIVYEEVKNGEHNFDTWSRIFPKFLHWAVSGNV